MSWRPHTDLPAAGEVAVIAAPCQLDGAPFLLPELYRFDVAEGRWFGARNVLLLKHEVFHWLPESELLQTIP